MALKLTPERRRYLSRYEAFLGWRIDMLDGVKKWSTHRDRLINAGLLERDGEGRGAMYRITDAGRAALKEGGNND